MDELVLSIVKIVRDIKKNGILTVYNKVNILDNSNDNVDTMKL